jgi:hypothetical protein
VGPIGEAPGGQIRPKSAILATERGPRPTVNPKLGALEFHMGRFV